MSRKTFDLPRSTLLTRARTEVFSVPTKKFISHELTVWLPYFMKRYILRRKIAKPPPIIEREEKEGKA